MNMTWAFVALFPAVLGGIHLGAFTPAEGIEPGLITPPVGVNVFAVKAARPVQPDAMRAAP